MGVEAMLSVQHFSDFFKEVHGVSPFPWQQRLLEVLVDKGAWPALLDLPTSSGKTATIDIALFHLALQADAGPERKAPVRIAFIVDRRLVVDDAFLRACKLEKALRSPKEGSITAKVARRLRSLSLDGPPLIVRRLRGGIPREDDWARTPSQPTILCSTVDQVGSRLLFRGYGVTDSMKPVQAGLLGSDCLLLLDEAHLAQPFRQTIEWLQKHRRKRNRVGVYAAPFGFALLTATPGADEERAFHLQIEDHEHPVLGKRLESSKPAQLVTVSTQKERQHFFIEAVKGALQGGLRGVGVIVNRVSRARALFESLCKDLKEGDADVHLLIGPARSIERDGLTSVLAPLRTGVEDERAALERPLVIVATQTIEAGVDIDLDALFTELAPIDALRQRFGRLNRNGRTVETLAAIVALLEESRVRGEDPIYGRSLGHTWQALSDASTTEGKGKSSRRVVDFGIKGFAAAMPEKALSPRPDAPVLMPAYLDLWSHTAPTPAADPDIALFLHGSSRQPDSVTVIWRADVNPEWKDQDVQRLLTLVPPRSGEVIALPVWAVRRWLSCRAENMAMEELADIPGCVNDPKREDTDIRQVFRWKGLSEQSQWIEPETIRPGDTIIVPASYGGVDQYGWFPQSGAPVRDVADEAAAAYRGRRYAVRIAPGLVGDTFVQSALSKALAEHREDDWEILRDRLLSLGLPDSIKDQIACLGKVRSRRGKPALELFFDLYGFNERGEPRGLVIHAPVGLKNEPASQEEYLNTTEDDASGSLVGFHQSLSQHSREVESKAEAFARAAGLPEDRVVDLKIAGFLHDEGKRDKRFQRWLHYGDPLGADPDDEETILAKSGRSLPPNARNAAGLPSCWRHEALSVRLARSHGRLQEAKDPALVLWLIGTHHGFGRPFFPHVDPEEQPPNVGPQSLAFDWNGLDWTSLFEELKARYGIWELARMEAILRLADHRASEEASRKEEGNI
jgi:CRISPR-associated helicase Cas3, subtype Dpsyc